MVEIGSEEHKHLLVECILSGQVPESDLGFWFDYYPDLPELLLGNAKN